MDGFDILGAIGEVGAKMPTSPPMSQFIPDMRAVGGIPYNGSKGKPNGFVGSYGLFAGTTNRSRSGVENLTQTDNLLMTLNPVYAFSAESALGEEHYGYVWGSFDRDNVSGGIPYGGRLEENQWNEIFGRYEPGASGDFNRVATAAEAFESPLKKSKHGKPFGPLVGNPNMPDFAKMRVDSQGNLFWLPQEVPNWLSRKQGPQGKYSKRMAEAIRRKMAAEQKIADLRRPTPAVTNSGGFDMLGATLADQYIILRIKRVDRDRLKAKLAGATGTLASSAVTMIDASAAAALNVALPIAVGKAKDYGVELEATFSDVPKNMRSHSLSEFWPGLGIGIALGAASLAIVKLVGGLASRVVSSK